MVIGFRLGILSMKLVLVIASIITAIAERTAQYKKEPIRPFYYKMRCRMKENKETEHYIQILQIILGSILVAVLIIFA